MTDRAVREAILTSWMVRHGFLGEHMRWMLARVAERRFDLHDRLDALVYEPLDAYAINEIRAVADLAADTRDPILRAKVGGFLAQVETQEARNRTESDLEFALNEAALRAHALTLRGRS